MGSNSQSNDPGVFMIIVKIGGGAAINYRAILSDLSAMKEQMILVHGANALRDELATKLGKEKKVLTSVSGYSSVFSDQDAIEVLMMAYAGVMNTRIVESCQQLGINAVGLSGVDGHLIMGERNKGIKIKEGSKTKLVRDFSGKPRSINKPFLDLLLNNQYVPVLCVPICDETKTAINSENDDIIAVLQEAYHATTIFQFIEAPGLLANKEDPTSVIAKLSSEELLAWEARSDGRMKRKLHALTKLFAHGPCRVILADGRIDHPIQAALSGKGTVIV